MGWHLWDIAILCLDGAVISAASALASRHARFRAARSCHRALTSESPAARDELVIQLATIAGDPSER